MIITDLHQAQHVFVFQDKSNDEDSREAEDEVGRDEDGGKNGNKREAAGGDGGEKEEQEEEEEEEEAKK